MPILEVQLVGEPPESVVRDLAQRLANAADEVYRSGPQGTWVKVQFLPRQNYAENGGGPPEGVLPVFVFVLKRDVPRGDALKAEISALTKAIAAVCDRAEENVHVVYEPPAAGRVAFGGHLVE